MKTKLYVYIGGKGTSANNEYVQREGGYNGGGIGGTDSSKSAGSAGGGGGATDIRRALNALYERIIVAGGGSSGNTFYPNMGGLGASGGGELGEDGSYNSQYVVNGKGGSQTQGGEAYTARGATSGAFGFG